MRTPGIPKKKRFFRGGGLGALDPNQQLIEGRAEGGVGVLLAETLGRGSGVGGEVYRNQFLRRGIVWQQTGLTGGGGTRWGGGGGGSRLAGEVLLAPGWLSVRGHISPFF